MVKKVTIFSAAFFLLAILAFPASGDPFQDAVQTILDKYGKEKVIQAILQLRGNRITVQTQGTMREFIGPPSPDFITTQSVVKDLRAASADPKKLEEAVASLPAASSSARRNALWALKKGPITIYLLGSVTPMRRNSYPLPRVIEKAYRESRSLLFQVDFRDLEDPSALQKLAEESKYEPGKSLVQDISRETYELLRSKAASLGAPLSELERLKPWFCGGVLTSLELTRSDILPVFGVSLHYYNRAKRDGKECLFLQTLEEYDSSFASLGKELQEKILVHELKELDTAARMQEELISAWRAGDIAKIEERMKKHFEDLPEEIKETIYFAQNRRWRNRIEELMQGSRNAMAVVELENLFGKGGLLELLRQKGYEAEQN